MRLTHFGKLQDPPRDSTNIWRARQRGDSSWGFLIVVMLFLILVSIWGISDNKAVPDERAWGKNEIQKLSLTPEQQQTFQKDISVARDKSEVHKLVWTARWFGDSAYRAEKEKEMASQRAFDGKWGKWLSISYVIGGFGLIVIAARFVWNVAHEGW